MESFPLDLAVSKNEIFAPEVNLRIHKIGWWEIYQKSYENCSLLRVFIRKLNLMLYIIKKNESH
jgi:hypothetical protein